MCAAGVGLYNAIKFDPKVFAAISPHYAVRFFMRNGFDGWRMLGGILLCVTGTEAMFADLGHFSVTAIQVQLSPETLHADCSSIFSVKFHSVTLFSRL